MPTPNCSVQVYIPNPEFVPLFQRNKDNKVGNYKDKFIYRTVTWKEALEDYFEVGFWTPPDTQVDTGSGLSSYGQIPINYTMLDYVPESCRGDWWDNINCNVILRTPAGYVGQIVSFETAFTLYIDAGYSFKKVNTLEEYLPITSDNLEAVPEGCRGDWWRALSGEQSRLNIH